MGLWLVQECRRAWVAEGATESYADMAELAMNAPVGGPLFDPDLPELMAPGNMPARIRAVCEQCGQLAPGERDVLIRAVFESLACKYRLVLEEIERVTGTPIEVVHVIGGGARNEFLCRLTANVARRPVLAGPVEAAALGNILVQLGTLRRARLGGRDARARPELHRDPRLRARPGRVAMGGALRPLPRDRPRTSGSAGVTAYELLAASLADRGTGIEPIEAALRAQRIETPSWAFGNSGTRFGVFAQPGAPRTTLEKLEDAAEVHRRTGTAPSVALHIPWDRVDDFGAAARRGCRARPAARCDQPEPLPGAGLPARQRVQPRSDRAPQGDRPHPRMHRDRRARGLGLDLALARGRHELPGPGLARRPGGERLVESLQEAYAALPEAIELLVEYKLYEPAFYSTDLADWGAALTLCQELGPRARVLVDLGHHAQGVNIEQIVSQLQRLGRLGGFHFNDRKYGDDDLIVGSIDPFQLFLIFAELVATGAFETGVRLTIDQSHSIEPKVEAMIQSVVNLQEAYAKALLVDRAALEQAQHAGDVLAGHRVLLDAFATDVRPLCAKVRADLGASPDPVAAHRDSGYAAAVAERRAGGKAAGWN